MTQAVRDEFMRIKLTGQRNALTQEEKKKSDLSVIEYMNLLLSSGKTTDFKDKCFCFWNISDSYAMLRNPAELYKNHLKFAEYVSTGDKIYGFWTVSDCTQRFTLISGDYENFWHDLYKVAVENTPVTNENYRIAYEAHRAALSVHSSLDIPYEHLKYYNEKFSEFLESSKSREEYSFYSLIFLSAQIKAFKRDDIYIEDMCAEFFEALGSEDTATVYAVGEWEYLNRFRSKREQSVVGITAAINSLIDIGEKKRAIELYNEAKQYGLPENTYVNKRIY